MVSTRFGEGCHPDEPKRILPLALTPRLAVVGLAMVRYPVPVRERNVGAAAFYAGSLCPHGRAWERCPMCGSLAFRGRSGECLQRSHGTRTGGTGKYMPTYQSGLTSANRPSKAGQGMREQLGEVPRQWVARRRRGWVRADHSNPSRPPSTRMAVLARVPSGDLLHHLPDRVTRASVCAHLSHDAPRVTGSRRWVDPSPWC